MDLRRVETETRVWSEAGAVAYIASKLHGVQVSPRSKLLRLAELAEREAKRRKLPSGEDEWTWRHDWRNLARLLREWADRG